MNQHLPAAAVAAILIIPAVYILSSPELQSTFTSASPEDPLLFQGEPFFPLGLYDDRGLLGPPEGIPWEEVAEAGFNLVHYTNLGLAQSQQEPPGILRSVQIDPKEYGNPSLPQYLQDHATPNQLFWEFIDEPLWHGFHCDDDEFINLFPGLLALRNEENADGAPLWVNFVSSHAFSTGRVNKVGQQKCVKNIGAQVVSSDHYPFYGRNNQGQESMQQTLRDAQLVTDFISPSGHSMAVLQGFGSFMEPCSTPPCPRTAGRFPTRDETRFMAYGTIAKGAKGIMWWGLTSSLALYENDTVAWRDVLWENRYRRSVIPVLQELRSPDIYPALIGRNRIHPPTEAPIVTLQTEGDEAWYIIAVNNSAEFQRQKKLHTTAHSGLPVTVVQENRYLQRTASGTFKDDFNPWGVHVYNIKKPAGS